MREFLLVFDLASAQTLAVIRAVDGLEPWDRSPGPGIWTLRDQLRHLALVRESMLRCLAGLATAGLGAVFETQAWCSGASPELATAFEAHVARCQGYLHSLEPQALDRPFTTPFGNLSSPRNYLRMMLLEETHHRAQMTMALRFFGLEPPEYPGRAWVELGIEQRP